MKDAEFERRGGLKAGYYRDLMKRGAVEYPSVPKMIAICKALDRRPDEIFPELEKFYPPEAIEYLNTLDDLRKRRVDANQRFKEKMAERLQGLTE